MEQIDEKKNSEELVGLINSGTKDIFNKREVASRLGEDVANRIKDGLEEKKDEKETGNTFMRNHSDSIHAGRLRQQG